MGSLREKREIPDELVDAVHYDRDTGIVTWNRRSVHSKHDKAWNSLHAGKEIGTAYKGYRLVSFRGGRYLLHRIVWRIISGEQPSDQIDHISGDRSDNRPGNLRDVSSTDNLRNKCIASNNSSGVTGVHWHAGTGRWRAVIYEAGKQKFLGRFDSIDDAIAARKQAERSLGYHPNHGRKNGSTPKEGDGNGSSR